jgi:hypothetical protein
MGWAEVTGMVDVLAAQIVLICIFVGWIDLL